MSGLFYFPHDFKARHDSKLERLRFMYGCESIGIYWCIIEMLYENGGYINKNDFPCIAKSLNTTEDKLLQVVDTELFINKNGEITSNGVIKRIEKINKKTDVRKEAAKKRWGKKNTVYANAMQMHSKCNASGPESKVKKRKEKKRKEKKILFVTPTINDVRAYCEANSLKIQPENFFTYYEANGWMVGKNKMKNWKAAIKHWELKNTRETINEPKPQGSWARKL